MLHVDLKDQQGNIVHHVELHGGAENLLVWRGKFYVFSHKDADALIYYETKEQWLSD